MKASKRTENAIVKLRTLLGALAVGKSDKAVITAAVKIGDFGIRCRDLVKGDKIAAEALKAKAQAAREIQKKRTAVKKTVAVAKKVKAAVTAKKK